MGRIGKKRKEIYLSLSEVAMIKEAQKTCGLDETNTMRMLMNLGWFTLTNSQHNVGNNTQMVVKQHFIK